MKLMPFLMLTTSLWLTSAASAAQIYSCTDAQGRKLTSDRVIPECHDRHQRVLNADGSTKRVIPPTMTLDELAEYETKQIEQEKARIAQMDAIRRDRNLLLRFPNEAAHQKSREAAIEDMRRSVRFSEKRLQILTEERKPLIQESEFYAGRQLPAKLKSALEANEATAAAQRAIAQNQEVELVRINALYDTELERLKKLWAGTPPGSLGDSPQPAPSAASVGVKSTKKRR
jgi:Domain of unknown function (DUF4124)